MKKVLFATTALVASAGYAAAQDTGVALSGQAEIGVFEPGDGPLQFHTDIDVTFTMSGTTDGGLTFGANIDLDESTDDDAFNNDTQGGEAIFLSGPFGTLTMGDTDGAFDWALQEAIIGSAIADDHEHAGYSGNSGLDGTYDGQIARYEYAFGDFAVAVSAEIDDNDGNDPALGIGARYSTNFAGFGVGLGLGYQRIGNVDLGEIFDDEDDDDRVEVYGISADVSAENGIRAIVNYSEANNFTFDRHYGIAVGYTFDAITVAANYGNFNRPDGDGADGYGLIFNYDLGGGAQAQFGYGRNRPDDDDNFNTYSLGVAMSF